MRQICLKGLINLNIAGFAQLDPALLSQLRIRFNANRHDDDICR